MGLVEAVFDITGLDLAAIINASLNLLDTLLSRFLVPELHEYGAELGAQLHEILRYDGQHFELCHALQFLREVFSQLL